MKKQLAALVLGLAAVFAPLAASAHYTGGYHSHAHGYRPYHRPHHYHYYHPYRPHHGYHYNRPHYRHW